jgi:hypothetical protein
MAEPLKKNKNGHVEGCGCLVCKHEHKDEIGPFGQWSKFRDFVDAMCDQFKPKKVIIYPKFAVLKFDWTTDRKRMLDYLEDRSQDRYTGIYFEGDEYDAVIIDVTEEGPTE